jgi:hypothetical protein
MHHKLPALIQQERASPRFVWNARLAEAELAKVSSNNAIVLRRSVLPEAPQKHSKSG